MAKLDFEAREFKYKEALNREELIKLIEKMRKKGFDYEAHNEEENRYSFIKFNRK